MPAQLRAFQKLVIKHIDFPIGKYWVWALRTTLARSPDDRGIGPRSQLHCWNHLSVSRHYLLLSA